MTSRGVSALKFVGTVSLGLLTGLSYTLSTLTVPSLLTLPSAKSASTAFEFLVSAAKKHLQTLGAISSTSFFLAYLLSPRIHRHPYLIYTTILVGSSSLITSDFLAPYFFNITPPATPSQASQRAALKKKEKQDRKLMEASYDILGSSEAQLSKSDIAEDTSSEEETEPVNGEEVRKEVKGFLKKQAVQTFVSGLGFLVAVVGIWGDGVAQDLAVVA